MGFIVAFILLIIGVYFHKKNKTWACPEVLFCYEWTLISFLASLRLFSLYEASFRTWAIILIGSIFFVIGCCGGYKTKGKVHGVEGINSEKKIVTDKMFWLLAVLIILYTIPDLSESIHYMRLGISLDDIRSASVGLDTVQGYTKRTGAFWEYIDTGISVMELLVTGYGITEYIKGNKNNNKYILIVLVITLMRAFAYGGRFGIAYVIIELLVCLKLSNGTFLSKMSFKLKKRAKWIVASLIMAIILITLFRGAAMSDLVKKYYRYICGNIVFFDLHVKEMSMDSMWSFTFAGFYGFWSLILPILNGLGIRYPKIYLNTTSQIMDGQTFRRIGDSLWTNAFITPFYHLYADFRLMGVILGMLLFGFVAGVFYKKYQLNRDNYSIACYLIMTQMIFKSLQTYPFATKIYFLVFIVFLLKEKNVKIKLGVR